jgi:hypothetical protein
MKELKAMGERNKFNTGSKARKGSKINILDVPEWTDHKEESMIFQIYFIIFPIILFYFCSIRFVLSLEIAETMKSHALESMYIDHGRTMSLSLNDQEFGDLSGKLLDLAALDLGKQKDKNCYNVCFSF